MGDAISNEGAGAALEVATGPAAGERLAPEEHALEIGRYAAGASGLGGDPELSRRHARLLRLEDGGLLIEDLGSTNGTQVNGARIDEPRVLSPGDEVKVGTTTLRVVPDAAAGPPADAPDLSTAELEARRGRVVARLAALAYRRHRRLLALSGLFFVLAAVLGAPVVGELKSEDDFLDPSAESVLGRDALERAAGTKASVEFIALVETGQPVDSSQTRELVDRVSQTIRAKTDVVAEVFSFYSTRDRAFVSRDGQSTFVAAVFKLADEDRASEATVDLQAELEQLPGVSAGGPSLLGETVGETVGEDLAKAEAMAFPLLFIASLFVFRGVIAALLPLFVGVLTIFGTFLILRLIAQLTSLSVFSLNIVVALGLGLAIDYSLFVLTRYREEALRSGYGGEALARTLQTAGRTVFFSALTVMAALASLLVFPQRFLYSMGVGGVACTMVALAASLVALPALLAALGPRVDALSIGRWRRASEAGETAGFWYRFSRAVMRRPGTVAAVTAIVLVAAGLPFLRVEFTGFDSRSLPESNAVREVEDKLQAQFPRRPVDSLLLAVRAPGDAGPQLEADAAKIRALDGVETVEPPQRLGDAGLWQIDVIPRHPQLDDRTLDLVNELRDRASPFPVSVAGRSAEFVDQQESLGERLPLALALLCVVTVLILFVMTGSVVLPIKSLIMNALSVSAAFGLLVLIFQDGRLEGVLAYDSLGALEASQPIILFALAFGLSTDYAVFLLTRIKEARSPDRSEEEAVALGLQRTGRIVTAAALLFSIAVGAFATSEIVFIKQLGIGTALAVLIDATIVRALLVPSLMALLGSRNWWAPAPLRRLHARIGQSEG